MGLKAKQKIAVSRRDTMARRTAELAPSLKKELLRKETHRLNGAVKHIQHKIAIQGGEGNAHKEE